MRDNLQSTSKVEPEDWPEVLATVTACVYDVRAGRAIAFGLPSSKHFRISYNYWADGALHTGEFFSETAVPQGNLFPIRYDPNAPHENTHQHAMPATRVPVLAIGFAGTIVLLLVWILVARGCM